MQRKVTRTDKYSSLRSKLNEEKKTHYKKVKKLTLIFVVVVSVILLVSIVLVVVKKANSNDQVSSEYSRVIDENDFIELYRYSEEEKRYINITKSKSIMDDFDSNTISFEPNKNYLIYFKTSKTCNDDIIYGVYLVVDKENRKNYKNIEYAFISDISNSNLISSWNDANINDSSIRNLYNDVKNSENNLIELSKNESLIKDDTGNYHALAFFTNDKYNYKDLYLDIQIKRKDILELSTDN